MSTILSLLLVIEIICTVGAIAALVHMLRRRKTRTLPWLRALIVFEMLAILGNIGYTLNDHIFQSKQVDDLVTLWFDVVCLANNLVILEALKPLSTVSAWKREHLFYLQVLTVIVHFVLLWPSYLQAIAPEIVNAIGFFKGPYLSVGYLVWSLTVPITDIFYCWTTLHTLYELKKTKGRQRIHEIYHRTRFMIWILLSFDLVLFCIFCGGVVGESFVKDLGTLGAHTTICSFSIHVWIVYLVTQSSYMIVSEQLLSGPVAPAVEQSFMDAKKTFTELQPTAIM
ncbi:hypothetical protein EDD86DRAFT_70920 [Gorgonomyces haynaldii]|nr:hypothetical protein EDD86DRAFT_70920 [Gorgonomyces haynaldii]